MRMMENVANEFLYTTLESGKNIALEQAREIDAWLPAHAPWRDRTGRARRGLAAWVEYGGGPIGTIVIAHDQTLDYVIWLEIANQGRYSIIRPALDYWAPRTKRSLQNMVNLGIISMGKKTRKKK